MCPIEQNPVATNVADPPLQGFRSSRHLSSLRQYLDALRDLGELQEIAHEVDWNLEIGAVTRRCYETGAPAPLFGRVKGAAPALRVLRAPAGLSARPGQRFARVAGSVGLPPAATARDISQP